MARPIIRPAQPSGARESTARAITANISRNVPITSATIPCQYDTPGAREVDPRPRSTALVPNAEMISSAPTKAPTSWARM